MRVKYKTFEWIHPNVIILNCKLFSIYFKHVGFFDDDFIINYNHLLNKCDYDIKIKEKHVVINNIEKKPRRNYLKFSAKQDEVLPILFDMTNNEKMRYRIELVVYRDIPTNLLANAVIEIEYYPNKRKYKIREATIKENESKLNK